MKLKNPKSLFGGVAAMCLLFCSAGNASVTYLSSLSEDSFGFVVSSPAAQSFVTGNNPNGYVLDTVRVNAETNFAVGGGNFVVSICNDANGGPGPEIALLSGPNPNSSAVYTYTAPPDIGLQNSTKYWIKVSHSWLAKPGPVTSTGGWSMGTNNITEIEPRFCMAINATAIPPVTRYFQDFSAFSPGATNFGDGSQLFSTHLGSVAAVQENTHRELQLTSSGTGNTRSAFRLPDLNPGSPIFAFSAKWNAQVYGNFPNAADGFSFNFGQLGSGTLQLAGTGYFQESGYGTGISFGVQTFSGNNPGFYLRVNGLTHASVTNNPVTQWGVNNGRRHFWEVDWNYTNGLTARLNGQVIFSNVPTYGFSPRAGDRFVWAARSGAFSEEVRLDNISVVTGGNLVQAPTTSPYYADAGSPSVAFDGGINDGNWWSTTNMPCFVGATLSSADSVLAYALTSGNPNRSQDPASWTLEGSGNNGTNWYARSAGSGTFIFQGESRAWLADNGPPYGAWRLNISQNNGNPFATTLGELRFYTFKRADRGWKQISAGSQFWTTVACSADGNLIWAGSQSDGTWVYGYYGNTLERLLTGVTNNWTGIACTADGYGVVGTVFNGTIYRIPFSHLSGPNWIASNAENNIWNGVVSSADGTRLAAIAGANGIYTSVDRGSVWSWQHNGPWGGSKNLQSIASSSDGQKLAVAIFNGVSGEGIYTSSNYGTNWTKTSATNSYWVAITSSGDGNRLVAANNGLGSGGTIWYSHNGGVNWTQSSAPSKNWTALASSVDGNKIVATGGLNTPEIYLSEDGGVTWTQSAGAPAQWWTSVASSADGRKLVAVTAFGAIWQYDDTLPGAPVPTIVSQTVSDVPFGATTATLNAQINPNNLNSAAWLQWGSTTNYGNTSSIQSIGNGGNAVSISANLTGLIPGTYHFRAVATNVIGTNYGNAVSFVVPATNAFFNIALPGNPVVGTSANSPTGQGATKAIDGTADSKYLNLDKLNTGLTIFPAMTGIPVRALGLISAEDAPERDPASFEIYGSPDGTNFTFIAGRSIPPFPARNSIQSFAFPGATAHAYKVIFPAVQNPASANSMQIAQVELLPYVDVTSPNDTLDLLLPEGASLNGIGPASALLDRKLRGDADKVVVLNVSTSVVAIITPATGASVVKGMELIGGNNDADFPERTPSILVLEGSNDGTNFTTLISASPRTPSANLEIQGFSCFENTVAFSQYRVTLGAPRSGSILQVGEVRLFGLTFPTIGVSRSGNNVTLSWPVSAGSFLLQESSALSAGNWVNSTNTITPTNEEFQVIVSPAAGATFYRLQLQ